jgi:soluble lytic murein transglycosylase-like protein
MKTILLCAILLCTAPIDDASGGVFEAILVNFEKEAQDFSSGVTKFLDGLNETSQLPISEGQRVHINTKIEVVEKLSSKDEKSVDEIIVEAGKANDLDPRLIKAVAKQESKFDPNAVSRKGAKGIMQLSKENCESMGIDPFDPHENIHGGSKLLAEYLERFRGNLRLALAAYNAGPTIVERHNKVPDIQETQKFVRVVMADYKEAKKNG